MRQQQQQQQPLERRAALMLSLTLTLIVTTLFVAIPVSGITPYDLPSAIDDVISQQQYTGSTWGVIVELVSSQHPSFVLRSFVLNAISFCWLP